MLRLTQVSVVANPALLKLKNFGITVMPTTEITAKEKLQTVKKEQTSFYDEEKPLMVIDYNTHSDELCTGALHKSISNCKSLKIIANYW